MTKKMYEVVSVRDNKGFVEEYQEKSFVSIDDAKALSDKLAGNLTREEQSYNRVEVRTELTDMGYDVVYETNGAKSERQLLIHEDLIKSNLDLRGAIKVFNNKDDYEYELDDMNDLAIFSEDPDGEYYTFEWDGDYEITLNEDLRHFSNMLESHGVSGYRLALDSGISQSTISDYVQGLTLPQNIPAGNISKIADALGIGVEDVYNWLKI